jgi:dCMP deaminase
MNQYKFDKYDIPMMKTAQVWAEMSKCVKSKVGAVIAKENNIISVGYNGTPTGYKSESIHDCEEIVERDLVNEYEIEVCTYCGNDIRLKEESDEGVIYYCNNCDLELDDIEVKFKKIKEIHKIRELKTDHDRVLHAEQNALMYAARMGHSTKDATMYITLSPCSKCAILIAQAGIKRVVYLEKYRDDSGIKKLEQLGVEVNQLILEK